jgi:hypothetical protein
MSSANGFGLDVVVAGKAFVLTASWAAPYFVMITGVYNDKPFADLHHCDDLAHAVSVQRAERVGASRILNADFTEYAP